MTALKSIGLVVAGVIVGLLFSVAKEDKLGGVYNQVSNHFISGLYGGSADQFRVDGSGNSTAVDVTVGQDLILTDNDFCINFYSTSTATLVKMVASTTVASGSNIGVMTMQYGSCVE
jgi:hypothetical protein